MKDRMPLQVRPASEGWTQQVDTSGRPLLQFRSPRRTQPATHLADLNFDERKTLLAELGQPAFRAKQLSIHYFEHFTTDPEAMTDLPAAARGELVDATLPPLLSQVRRLVSDNGETVKFLWRLFDGCLIESVLMRYPERITLCVSSQAGCGMNCPFCATGQAGLQRNLSTAEIVEQVRLANLAIAEGALSNPHEHSGRSQAAITKATASAGAYDSNDTTKESDSAAATEPHRVNNIVFMGMGEPLANYKRLMNAVARITSPAPEGFGIGTRHLTVSSVGIVPAIRKLADEGLQLTFALSLHAPDDDLRDELIPVNNRWKVDETLEAAYYYYEKTGRRVSIEYALIRDMNDQAWRAQMLADKLNERGRGWVHVNPIPLNPTPGSIWTASRPETTREFIRVLTAAGIPTTLRDTRGSDIDGACGQLAAAE